MQVFQHTVRYNNYQSTAGPRGMMIWNGVKGGVYRFPCAARMSTERKRNETSDQYFNRYDDAVDGLLKYPNYAETYEGQSKDHGAYRVGDNVVRREFAIDIRRVERKFCPTWQPVEMPKGASEPRKRKKETIYINDVHRKTEQAYIEDQRDGQLGGVGQPNDETETLPTIDIDRLYISEMEDRPDPWIVPAEKELELRARRMDTINPDISHSSLKRPYLHNEFDEEYSKDHVGNAAYFVINTDPRPLKINGTMLLYQGQMAGPLPSFAFFEAPGGQIAFWWGIMGIFYKPVPQIARALGNIVERYSPESPFAGFAGKPPQPPPPPPQNPRTGFAAPFEGTGSTFNDNDPLAPPPKNSVKQHQQSANQPNTETRNTVTTRSAAKKDNTRLRAQAAVDRERRFKAEKGARYGKDKYRLPPGVGSVRYTSVSLPTFLSNRMLCFCTNDISVIITKISDLRGLLF